MVVIEYRNKEGFKKSIGCIKELIDFKVKSLKDGGNFNVVVIY